MKELIRNVGKEEVVKIVMENNTKIKKNKKEKERRKKKRNK